MKPDLGISIDNLANINILLSSVLANEISQTKPVQAAIAFGAAFTASGLFPLLGLFSLH